MRNAIPLIKRAKQPHHHIHLSVEICYHNSVIRFGLPGPKEFTSMPRLRLVQAGIQRHVAEQGTNKDRIRLPITAILLQLHGHWIAQSANHDIKMIWAAAMICFFGFSQSGKITVPSITSFNPAVHLAWGDVSVDNKDNPTTLCIKLILNLRQINLGMG